MSAAQEEELQRIADFDHPFTVGADGTLSDASGVYAPDVFHSDADDIEIGSDDWRALAGYTGQYGYRGAVMHPSECLGGALARDILATPGVYVVTAVNVYADDENDNPEPAGWAVLRLNVPELDDECHADGPCYGDCNREGVSA